MDLRWIARPYHWPLLGPFLKKQARESGRRVFYQLVARGHPLEVIIKHGNQGVIRAAAVQNDQDLYLHLGLVNAARRMMKDQEDLDASLS